MIILSDEVVILSGKRDRRPAPGDQARHILCRLAAFYKNRRTLLLVPWIAVPLAVAAITVSARGQTLGTAPAAVLGVSSVYMTFRLPALRDTSTSALASAVSTTQVGK